MDQLVLVEPGRVELRQVPIPEPGPGEVILRIEAALTCGTDLKTYRRGHPKFKLPMPFGHEFSGTVWALGEGVNQFKLGEPLMLAPTAPCGHCYYCQRQLVNLCAYTMETMIHGGYAQYVRLPRHIVATNTFIKPSGLSFLEAALLEPLSCVVYGAQQMEFNPSSKVLIIGAGPIGLLYVALLRRYGVSQIAVLGRRERRLEAAAQLGAELIFDESQTSRDEVERELYRAWQTLPQVVIECTGLPSVWEEALTWAAPGGQVMFFGGCASGTTFNFPWESVLERNLTLKGAFHFTPQAVAQSYELLASGRLSLAPLISTTLPLSQYPTILSLLESGEYIKIGVLPQN